MHASLSIIHDGVCNPCGGGGHDSLGPGEARGRDTCAPKLKRMGGGCLSASVIQSGSACTRGVAHGDANPTAGKPKSPARNKDASGIFGAGANAAGKGGCWAGALFHENTYAWLGVVDDEMCCSYGVRGDGVSKRKMPLHTPGFPERKPTKPVGARGAGTSSVSVQRPERVWSKSFTLLAWGVFLFCTCFSVFSFEFPGV